MEPKPQVVAVPLTLQGHINPLMELCKKLAARGFSISFINSDLNHQRMLHSLNISVKEEKQQQQDNDVLSSSVALFEEEGLDFRLLSLGDGGGLINKEETRDTRPPDVEKLVREVLAPGFREALQRLMDRLVEDEARSLLCIISDMRLAFTQDIAHKLGIPRVAFWTQSAASFATNLIFSNGYRPPPDDTELITCIPGAPPHTRSQVSFVLTVDRSNWLSEFGASPFERVQEPAWILINTLDGMEPSAMAALRNEIRILTTGPLLLPPFFNFSVTAAQKSTQTVLKDFRASGCLDWLDAQAPSSVLYVSFGTLATRSPLQLEELAFGLEASGQPFLLVFRPDLMPGNPASFLDGILHRTNGNAKVVSWAPQFELLSHPSVGGFLTHCGWNSILESVTAGKPMLSWPTFADQDLNARCVADEWRIGMDLEVDECRQVKREEVTKKVKELMEGKEGREVRENVSKLRDAAHKAIAPGGSSTANLELFVRWLEGLSS